MANPSILTSTKKLLGIEEAYTDFDSDIVMHINSVFATLNQLGVGPDNGFMIEDKTELWAEFLGTNPTINSVKSYMVLKVRLLFDPPSTSFAITAMEKQTLEYEWRLKVQSENAVLRKPITVALNANRSFRYLTIPQGTSWEVRWPLQDASGTASDLTGWTPRAQARTSLTDLTLLHEWTVAAGNISIVGSSISMRLSPAVSSAWLWRTAVFDVELVHTDGRVARIGRGELIIDPEVTK